MSLNTLKIKPVYKSKNCDIIKEFYIPVLSVCKNYDRVSAYFDSRILSLYACGIEHIYKNNGKIRFVFSYELSEADFILMQDGYKNKTKINDELLSRISPSDIDIDFSNLAFLISIGIIEVKIAFTSPGIFHDKYGLMYDKSGYLYFRGSNNETIAAIINNYESFETTTSWNCDFNEKEKINQAIIGFDELWNNDAVGVIVKDIPDCVKEKIISYSKGKIILSFPENPNAFILDINDNFSLIGKNNLPEEKRFYLNPEMVFCKIHLLRYIKKIQDCDYFFKENLSYVEIKTIIDSVIKYSQEQNFDCSVSKKLLEYIKNCDIEIEKRRSLGIAIKNKSIEVKKAYENFKAIVNTQMARPLYEEQMWDAFHISTMIRSANFSVPGSGKTSITYGAYAYLSSEFIDLVDKIVVIGPKNCFTPWKDEFYSNFEDKKVLKCIDIQSDTYTCKQDKYNAIKYESYEANLILINYESLDGYLEAIKSIINKRTLLVFDEIHRIKAINGERASCALEICRNAYYKVGLTGTPIPNSYEDIYNLLHILFPEEYDLFFKFDIGYLKGAANSFESMKKINDAIYPFFCRITKEDLKISHAEDDNLDYGYIEMNAEEKKLMAIIHRRCGSTLLKYVRLLQAASYPKLILQRNAIEVIGDSFDENSFYYDESFTPAEINFIESFDHGRKIAKGIELVEELVSEGHSVICWCVFIDTINYVLSELNNKKIPSTLIYGATSNQDREERLKAFKNGDIKVLVTNPHTLSESISLHKVCHNAIYFEYTFNLIHMLQSRDRINRLGLEKNQKTLYFYMVLNSERNFLNAIDLRTYERLKEKEKIQKKAIENKEIKPISNDMIEDIKKILGDIY